MALLPRVAVPSLSAVGLLLGGCTAVLDFDSYVFGDAGTETTPGLPLEPGDAADAGVVVPTRPSVPKPVADAGGADDTPPDASSTPPPAAEPGAPSRPVVIDAPEALLQLSGSPTGGTARSASCPGGIISGIVFQYWTSAALEPDRLAYVWPVCSRLLPSVPTLAAGEEFEPSWLVSEPTDPVFALLRENEDIDALICPDNQYLVGIDGTYDDPVPPSVGFRSLGIHCAGLGSDAERSDVTHSAVSVAGVNVSPVDGAFAFTQECPEGRAASQLDLRFGNWLDAVGLACSVVRWPFGAGHTCAAGPQCQSGSCGGDGLCAP
ncbi:MAG TPA: hypothetical protein VMG12_03130 [Polyangiaceae bacterium]|nr:hypothetical protein [Polyangiaceae bacterium]